VIPLRIAFLVSGNGTLFEYISEQLRESDLNASSVLLLSSNPDAPALDRAKRLDIPSLLVQRSEFASGDAFSDAIIDVLEQHNVNFVCLAGYMKRVPSAIVQKFHNRMLNIHPALLPAFGGKGMFGRHVHEAVLESGVRVTGVTVHLVDEEYDHGPIVLQRAVFVMVDDTPETLEHRVHEIEYQIYMDAIRLFAQNRIQVEGRRVRILPGNHA
jgi:phosphoribosylglycinamide formyltransferase-1